MNAWMMDNSYDTTELWEDIEDIIIKTLISAHPVLKHNYRTCFPNHITGCACFEILGFDILLDRKLKPWLLEVSENLSGGLEISPSAQQMVEGFCRPMRELELKPGACFR